MCQSDTARMRTAHVCTMHVCLFDGSPFYGSAIPSAISNCLIAFNVFNGTFFRLVLFSFLFGQFQFLVGARWTAARKVNGFSFAHALAIFNLEMLMCLFLCVLLLSFFFLSFLSTDEISNQTWIEWPCRERSAAPPRRNELLCALYIHCTHVWCRVCMVYVIFSTSRHCHNHKIEPIKRERFSMKRTFISFLAVDFFFVFWTVLRNWNDFLLKVGFVCRWWWHSNI